MEDLLPDVALGARGTSEPARGGQGQGRELGAWKVGRGKGWEWAVLRSQLREGLWRKGMMGNQGGEGAGRDSPCS